MSVEVAKVQKAPKNDKGRFTSYVIGYILSLYLTITAYLIVKNHLGSNFVIIALIAGLALVQFLVQLFYFMHLGLESKPRFKLLVLGFMMLVVGILVGGSLWIMYSLNYNSIPKTPQQINQYMNDQGGF